MVSDRVYFEQLDLSTIDEYAELTSPDKKHHLFNGPYYKQDSVAEHKEYIQGLKRRLQAGEEDVKPSMRLIVMGGKIAGSCSWYWKSKETNWLEVGIVVFDDTQWSKGIGTRALREWITLIFEEHPEIVRIGLSTWSGNQRMVRLAEKIGLHREACYRKARIVKGQYYDSVSYGILREEWKK